MNFRFYRTFSFLLFLIISSCQVIPLKELEKKYTVSHYVSPSREKNINVHDYNFVFVANISSKKFNIVDVKCNREPAKLFLLNKKGLIISEFNKNDTVLLRTSILRNSNNPSKDTITINYKYKNRSKSLNISDFIKSETPINQ